MRDPGDHAADLRTVRKGVRSANPAQTERTQVVATGGLRSGERVCITPIAGASEGMRVNAREARPLPSSARAREPS